MRFNVSSITTALSALSSAVSNRSNTLARNASLVKRDAVGGGVELRILTLGDSITNGFRDPTGDGYRAPLQSALQGSGKIVFVGDLSCGTAQCAGYDGDTINQISNAASHAISTDNPNIILLHAGTNDLHPDPPPDPYNSAPERLGNLIDQCIKGSPSAAIIVAQIIDSGDAGTNNRIQTFDAAVPGIVEKRSNAGHHVMVVDMRKLTPDEMADDLHPNLFGYKQMAVTWLAAMKKADAKGWIKKPIGKDPAAGSTTACSKGQKRKCLGRPAWYNPGGNNAIASGVGHGGNGKFTVDWVKVPSGASGIGLNGTGIRFADLDGDGRADYLWVNETNGAVIAYLNTGTGDTMGWAPVNDGKPIASGIGPRAGVRFADLSGNGKADYLFVDKSGAVQAYTNGGPSKGGWRWVGPKHIASGVPHANQNNVFFPDINGDGRADYVVVGEKGEVDLYLNIGSYASYDITWIHQSQIAGGLGAPNISLVDVTGDGRADYMIWDQHGGLTGYLNARGPADGKPVWLDQGPDKSIAQGFGADWSLCRLADFNGDGKADYAIVSPKNGGITTLYLNNGKAGTDRTGDGIFLADMDGDGIDDYLFCDVDGTILLYTNQGPGAKGDWVWVPFNSGKSIASGVGQRHQIRLAKIFSSGRADYVVVDDKTGAIDVWENGGADPRAGDGEWLWIEHRNMASGLGAGAGVRFADINGDGKDDYIWLSEAGAVTVYVNEVGVNPAKWVAMNNGKPVASGVGALREDVRFADIDGDGRADYIWVHPMDGSVEVWRNEAVSTAPGGINWVPYSPKKIADGVGYAGANVQFAYINKPRTGRADYVVVEPSSGALKVWLSDCGDLAPASSDDASGGDCAANPTSIPVPSGGSTNPSSQPSGSPNNPSKGGTPTSAVETSIPGLTVSGVITVGNPTIYPGAMPTGGGISQLQPLASEAAQLFASAESAVASLARASNPGTDDVSSAEQLLADTWSIIQQLLGIADQIDPKSVSGSDAQVLQNLRNKLPPLLTQLGGAIEQLAPSTRGTPDHSVVQQVAGLLGGSGSIGQIFGSIIQPVASLPAPNGGGGGGGGGGGRGEGGNSFSVPGYTTIPINVGLDAIPTAGPSAISALGSLASNIASAIDAAATLSGTPPSGSDDGGSDRGSGGSGSDDCKPSGGGLLGGLLGLIKSFSCIVGDATTLSSGLDSLELSSFAPADVSRIVEAQPQGRNLVSLLENLFTSVVKARTQTASWLSVSGLAHKELVASGIIGVQIASVIALLIGISNKPLRVTQALSHAHASGALTSASSTSTPLAWILNTVPGTSISDFESFIKTLPDEGTGRRIAYATADHQWYAGRMTLDQARLVSRNPIVDQVANNELRPGSDASDSLEADTLPHPRTEPLERRDPDIEIYGRINSLKHLRALSLSNRQTFNIANLEDEPYTFEEAPGAGTFIYVMDRGIDITQDELSRSSAEGYTGSGAIGSAFQDITGHGTWVASYAAGARLGVASSASIVSVKWKNFRYEAWKMEDVIDCFEWIYNHVVQNSRQGKAVIVFPVVTLYSEWLSQNHHYRYEQWQLERSDKMDAFLPVLSQAWRRDIALVFPTGNNPPWHLGMGNLSPQRYANPNNPLLIVGNMDDDGNPFESTPAGPALDGDSPSLVGETTCYGLAKGSVIPNYPREGDGDTRVLRSGGSSLASAQAAGLVAYLMTARSEDRFPEHEVAQAAKNRVRALARSGRRGAKGLMYNGVRGALCDRSGAERKMKARDASLGQQSPVEPAHLMGRQHADDHVVYDHGSWTNINDAQGFSCLAPSVSSSLAKIPPKAASTSGGGGQPSPKSSSSAPPPPPPSTPAGPPFLSQETSRFPSVTLFSSTSSAPPPPPATSSAIPLTPTNLFTGYWIGPKKLVFNDQQFKNTYSFLPAIYPVPVGTNLNECGDDYTLKGDTTPQLTDSPTYPIKLGTFVSGMLSDCTYDKQDANTAGTLTCNGGDATFTCSDDTHDSFGSVIKCDESDGTWTWTATEACYVL